METEQLTRRNEDSIHSLRHMLPYLLRLQDINMITPLRSISCAVSSTLFSLRVDVVVVENLGIPN